MLVPLAFAIPRRDTPASVATTALFAWLSLHTLAYSFVNLGAPYPWYLAVPVAALAMLTGIAVGGAWRTLAAGHRRRPLAIGMLALGTTCVLVALRGASSAGWPRSLDAWEWFESDRRLAGIFLRRHSAAGEVLDSPFGWPAYESRLPTNDTSGLNSVEPSGSVVYRIEERHPSVNGAAAPSDGLVPLATFDLANSRVPSAAWFVLVGRADSAVARSGARVTAEDVHELGDVRLVEAWRAHLRK
jgi:hypothetical protein